MGAVLAEYSTVQYSKVVMYERVVANDLLLRSSACGSKFPKPMRLIPMHKGSFPANRISLLYNSTPLQRLRDRRRLLAVRHTEYHRAQLGRPIYVYL